MQLHYTAICGPALPAALQRTAAKPTVSRFGIVASFAAVALLGCGGSPVEPTQGVARAAISGGDPVTATAWPTVVWLDNGCTGLLLAADLVVFAAHCGASASAAWLGDALDVSVDEDAGTVHVANGPSSRKIQTVFCNVHPNFELGTPTDVGFCRLAAPAAPEDWIVHPAQGCAEASIAVGTDATLVGFGRDSALGPPGIKRATSARVLTTMPDFTIGDSTHGTCAGDSCGPAFVRVGDDHAAEWAVAGILSGGPQGDACGVGYYAQLSMALPWLERASGVDLSPCFDDNGAWQPSAGCTRPALDESGLPTAKEASWDELCGPRFIADAPGTDGGCSFAGRSDGIAYFWALPILLAARRRRVRAAQAS